MDTFDYRKHVQEKVLTELKQANLTDPDWCKSIIELDPDIVIWFLKELVEKKEYVEEIFELAKIYAKHKNPLPEDDKINEKIEKGEEIRNIYTVRGSVCWLFTAIAATFRTEFYPEIISILEKLAFDPVYYVRIQSTFPLSFFAKNIRAYKHPDGTLFDFKNEDRIRVINLSFRMLEEHRDLPLILGGVINVFDALRVINETQAKEVISYFFYNSKEQLQPEYLTRQGVPLLLFFAEYRADFGDNFNGKWFQDFAFILLKLSEKNAPYLKSTFIWHTWKEIQSGENDYLKFKKYIPLFLSEELEIQALGQYDFLVKEVLKISPSDGVSLFKKELAYIRKWAYKFDIREHAWLLSAYEIVDEIAKTSPDNLIEVLSLLTPIINRGIYIGNLETIYKSYLLVPDKDKSLAMRPKIVDLYKNAKTSRWVNNLPEEI